MPYPLVYTLPAIGCMLDPNSYSYSSFITCRSTVFKLHFQSIFKELAVFKAFRILLSCYELHKDRYQKGRRHRVYLHLIDSDGYNCEGLSFQFAIGRFIDAGCYGDLKGQACLLISANKDFLLSFATKYQPQL
jgi:hypothetical protein